MRTQIADTNVEIGSIVTRQKLVHKILLICGIAYFPMYFAGHMLAGMKLEGYSHLNQQVSELSAVGSPARPLLTAFEPVYLVLAIAFGLGVWLSAGKKRSLQAAAIALVAFGIVGFLGWFSPMNPPGAEKTVSDTAHLIFTAVTVVSMVLFVGFGSGADGRWFRIYSILTILATLAAGAGVGTQASRIGEGLPTPWLGALERVSVYSPMVWMVVLAFVLLREQPEQKTR